MEFVTKVDHANQQVALKVPSKDEHKATDEHDAVFHAVLHTNHQG